MLYVVTENIRIYLVKVFKSLRFKAFCIIDLNLWNLSGILFSSLKCGRQRRLPHIIQE